MQSSCAQCEHPKPVNRYGVCRACKRELDAAFRQLEATETTHEALPLRLTLAQERYLDIATEWNGYLAEMDRTKAKAIQVGGAWFTRAEVQRIAVGALSDYHLIAKGVAAVLRKAA
jgi:hypothetical protein